MDVGAGIENDAVRRLLEVSPDRELVRLRAAIRASDERPTCDGTSTGHRSSQAGRTIVPDGQNRPASLPASLAILSWSSFVAGSSCTLRR